MKLKEALTGLSRTSIFAGIWIMIAAAASHSQALPAKRPLPRPDAAPASSAQEQKYKGIWEPVNYAQDLRLSDVYFVTSEVGYVSGASGTILKTTDGGKNWKAQLGGDPQSQEGEIRSFRFIDRTHGWALQKDVNDSIKLLRTTDGENWEPFGTLAAGWGIVDYQFLSPTVGIYIDGNNNVSRIMRTVDGGRTWKEVFPDKACTAKLEIQGLTQNAQCRLTAMHFGSPLVGYAVGISGADLNTLFLAKTEDGGATWGISTNRDFAQAFGNPVDRIFFEDENNGFLNQDHQKSSQPYRTTDGGRTWHAINASIPGIMKFADPDVGWVFDHFNYGFDYTLRYTTDGGTRWASRTFHFPAEVGGFSLPRRDRGYVAGNHGMIYRYRVVPANYQGAANSIDAPAMPGFDSTVSGQVATLNDVVAQLQRKLPAPAGAPAANSTGGPSGGFQQTGGTTTSAAVPSGGFQQDTAAQPAGGGYMDTCCGSLVQQLDTTANAFATDVPAFSQRFRNLNLILQGLNFLNSVANQANTLKQSIRALRQASNPQAAAAALNTVSTQVNGISSSGGFVQDVSTPPQP